MEIDRLANLFTRYRLAVVAAVAVATVVAAIGFPRLAFDDLPRNIFRTGNEDFRLLEEVFSQFGSDDSDCLLVVEADELFAPRTIAVIRGLVAEIQELESVELVRSLDDVVIFEPGQLPRSLLPPAGAPPEDYERARTAALAHPLIAGSVLTEDATSTLVTVRLAGSPPEIDEIDAVVGQLREVIRRHASAEDVRVRITGIPPIRAEIFKSVQIESRQFFAIGGAVSFVIALVLFRRFWTVVIVALAPIIGAFWTLGALGLVGEKINVINTVLPTLVMVVGFSDAVHLMHDIRRSRREGHAPLVASTSALRRLGIACALTSLTTAIGFGSLAVAEVEVIRRFGLACAFGALMAFAAVTLIVPLLAGTRLGQNVHTPAGSAAVQLRSRIFEAAIDWIIRHARAVTLCGIGLSLLLATSVFWLRPDNSLTEYIPPENESYQALAYCDQNFGGSLTANVLVEWPETLSLESPRVLGAISDVEDLLTRQPDVHYPLSVVTLLNSLPGPREDVATKITMLPLVPADVLGRFVRPDLRRAVVTARVQDLGTSALEPVFREVELSLQGLERLRPEISLRLTGTVVVASRNINQMITDLAKSLGLAAVVIFTVMALVFRSLRLGLISILPNTFPLVVTAAILVISGRPLQLTTVIVFSICLGIAVDDTIHFLTRFQRELRVDNDVNAAIKRSFVAVGTALVTTTVVMLAGFGSVLTSEMPSSRLFATMSCTAIAAALVGDLVILPAMLVCFVRPKQTSDKIAAAPETVEQA